jgi:hypothetical protein
MGKSKSCGKRPATPSNRKDTDQESQAKLAFWRRPVVWLGSVTTAITIGVLIGVLTPLAQRVTSPSTRGSSKSADVRVKQPLLIQSAGYLPGFNEVFTFPYPLNRAQMMAATRGISQGNFPNLKYVAALSGDPAYIQLIQVVLHSDVKQVATIREIRVVKQCTEPFSGTELWNPAQGAIGNLGMGFNLDSQVSKAQFINGRERFYGDYFAKKSIQLAPGESDTLSMFTLTTQHSCRFTFKLYTDYGSGQYVEPVNDNGKAFTASAGLPFRRFKVVYAGGDAGSHGAYVRVNPKTYNG